MVNNIIYHVGQSHLLSETYFKIIKSLRNVEQSISFVSTVAADGLAPRRLGYEVIFLSLKNNLISSCVAVFNFL